MLAAAVPWPALAATVAVLAALRLALRFARADADLTLLSKRPPPPGALRGSVVWIVGASQGLGEALALQFASLGARLVLSSRSLDKLEAVKAACTAYVPPEDVVLLPLDLSGLTEDIDEAAEAAFAAFERLDYVVHNAGASQHAMAEEASHGVAQKLVALNLEGPIAVARATLPLMLGAGSGRHVVVASMSAVVPSPGQAVYSAAKAGLRGYFSSLASEMAARGIGVTVVCPGPLATGSDARPRVVYGSTGLVTQAPSAVSKRRVPATRAAALIATAAWHGLDECWIAYHPVLLMGYLMQYFPSLGRALLKKVGGARAAALGEGKSGYDVVGLLKRSASAATARDME